LHGRADYSIYLQFFLFIYWAISKLTVNYCLTINFWYDEEKFFVKRVFCAVIDWLRFGE
jgi:hypothetical protein